MESNIPIPAKVKRQRRKKKDQRNPAEDLIRALTFILPAQKKSATTIKQNYCYIANIGTVLIHINLFGNGKARPLKIKVTK